MKINIDFIYPVGAIYMSINSTNPSTLFGGTWKQMTDDAYLKIVTSNAGETGGTSSDHKIPLTSMPSHRHNIYVDNYRVQLRKRFTIGSDIRALSIDGEPINGNTTSETVGGGQAYYPYYVGVYMWIRTA